MVLRFVTIDPNRCKKKYKIKYKTKNKRHLYLNKKQNCILNDLNKGGSWCYKNDCQQIFAQNSGYQNHN